MLTRTTLLTGTVVALFTGCGGSSEFSGGKGGTSGGGGSGEMSSGGDGDVPDVGGGSGKGGSSGSSGKGGSATSGKGGGSGKGGAASGGSSGTTGGAAGNGGTSPGGSSGSGTGEAGSGDTGGVAIDDAAGEVAVELCTKAFECCSAEEIQASQGVSSVVQCQLAVATIVQLQVNAAKPAIAAGRVEYDGAALERCMQDYGGQTCDMLRGLTSFACDGLIVPQQGEGDECGISAECIEGYCDGSSSASNPVGHCVPIKENGADCSANAECVSAFCDAGVCETLEAQPLCGG
jgi:hypothetical protein